MFQRIICLSYVFETKIVVSNVILKIRFAIIIEKSSSKTMFKLIITAKRDFLKENDMVSAKQCLFEFVIKELFVFIEIRNVDNRLIMFIVIKNGNDFLICVLSCNSNKFDMIFFINVIFENVKMRL